MEAALLSVFSPGTTRRICVSGWTEILTSGPESGASVIVDPLIALTAPIALATALDPGCCVCAWERRATQDKPRAMQKEKSRALAKDSRNWAAALIFLSIVRICLSLIYIGITHEMRDLQSFTSGP